MLMSFLKKSRINGLFSLAQFNRFTLLMLILLILAGAGLRFYSLGGKSMWDDEVITVEISAKDFTHIWQDLSWRQNSPPLHYLLVHFFLYFGLNEFWARFPSALFGSFNLILIFLLSKDFFEEQSSLIAVLILAISPFHIYYSQEARTYAVFTFFISLSYLYLFKLINSDLSNIYFWVIYGISSILSIYTHYFSVFHILAQIIIAITFFYYKQNDKFYTWLKFPLSWLIIGVISLPAAKLATQGASSGSGPSFQDWSLGLLLERVKLIREVFIELGGAGKNSQVIVFLFVIMFLVGLLSAFRHRARIALFLLMWLILPFISGLVFLEGRSFFHVRYFLPVTIPILILVAKGIQSFIKSLYNVTPWLQTSYSHVVSSESFATYSMMVIIFIGAFLFWPSIKAYYQTEKEDLRGAKLYVEQHMLPGDSIVLAGFAQPWLEFYFDNSGSAIKRPRSVDALKALTQPGRRVWYVYGWEDHTRNMVPDMFRWSQENASEHIVLPGELPVQILFWGPNDKSETNELLALSQSKFDSNPNDFDSGLTAADCLLTLGKWQEAIDLFEKLTSILWDQVLENPENSEARRYLTTALLGYGDANALLDNWSEAAKQYNDAMAIDPSKLSQRDDVIPILYHFIMNQEGSDFGSFKYLNLFRNNDLEHGSEGWGYYLPESADTSSVKFGVEDSGCYDGNGCLAIQGVTSGYHGGWYQTINISPENLYLYSCVIKSKALSRLNAKTLYWQVEGISGFGGEIEGNFGWRREVSIFRTPSNRSAINFWPVLLNGQGEILVDDVLLAKLPWRSSRVLTIELNRLENRWTQIRKIGLSSEVFSEVYTDLTGAYTDLAENYLIEKDAGSAKSVYEKLLSTISEALRISPDDDLIREDYLNTAKNYLNLVDSDEIIGSVNLFSNSGFETGTDAWKIYSPSGTESLFESTSKIAHSGSNSGHIQGYTPSYHGGMFQKVNLSPHSVYLFSAWLKSELASDAKVSILYREYLGGEGDLVGISGGEFSGSKDWGNVEILFVSPSYETNVLFYPALLTGEGNVWIDDVELVNLNIPR
jgi:mannosyltransferase